MNLILLCRAQERRHAELRGILQKAADDDYRTAGKMIAEGGGSKQKGQAILWSFKLDKKRQRVVLFQLKRPDNGGRQAAAFRPSEEKGTIVYVHPEEQWTDELGTMKGNFCLSEPPTEGGNLTIQDIIRDRVEHMAAENLQKVDPFITEILFAKLSQFKMLIRHLACPPEEYLLAPQAYPAGEQVLCFQGTPKYDLLTGFSSILGC